jgi:NAD kinase
VVGKYLNILYFSQNMKLSNVLVVDKQSKNKEHNKTLTEVKKVLKKLGINFKSIGRDKISPSLFKKKDLVITVGGDGTFLRTGHFVKDTPMFAVNSDPKGTEGFFTRAVRKDFEKKLNKILKDKFKIIKLTRMQSKLNKKILPERALNEIFVGHKKPYKMSRYELITKKRKETQKSSGILIGSGAGTHAWMKSVSGYKLPLNSKNYQYVVREPYEGKLFVHKMKKGLMKPNETMTIKSTDDMLVAMDSVCHYDFGRGSVLKVKVAKIPMNFVDV